MGQVERKCGSGTSDFHRPGRAEVHYVLEKKQTGHKTELVMAVQSWLRHSGKYQENGESYRNKYSMVIRAVKMAVQDGFSGPGIINNRKCFYKLRNYTALFFSSFFQKPAKKLL